MPRPFSSSLSFVSKFKENMEESPKPAKASTGIGHENTETTSPPTMSNLPTTVLLSDPPLKKSSAASPIPKQFMQTPTAAQLSDPLLKKSSAASPIPKQFIQSPTAASLSDPPLKKSSTASPIPKQFIHNHGPSSPPSSPHLSLPQTPGKAGPRNRTISLRSISSIMHHSRASSTPSAPSSKDRGVSLSPAASPMKAIPQKMATSVKKSIKRLSSSIHLPHVTFKLRPRSSSSSSAASLDISHHHSITLVPAPPSPHSSNSSYDFWTTERDKLPREVDFRGEHEEEREYPSHRASGDPVPVSLLQPIEHLTVEVDNDTSLVPVHEMSQSVPTEVPSALASTTADAGHPVEEVRDVQYPLSPSGLAMNTSVYVAPAVPDPFLVDEEGDELSEEEREEQKREASVAPSATSSEPAAHEIALSVNTTTPASPSSEVPILSPLNVNKDVPPPPPEEDEQDDEEDEVPDLYLPGLIIPTMFLPIPNTDPLTTLLTKYIYPPERRPVRDVTGEWKKSDVHTLVMTNSWRALARMARDRIVSSSPADIENILGLWYLRLASLARLRLSNQTAAECTNLFAVISAIEPIESRHWVYEKVLPFELEVMYARVKYWAGDHMGYLDALSALLRKCKRKAREAGSGKDGEVKEVKEMWKERGARICLILASQLVEMRDFTAATKLLEPLCIQTSDSEVITNPSLRSAIARIYLQGGNVQLASHHFSLVAQDPSADETLKRMNEAILNGAEGEWARSVDVLKELIRNDAENYVAVNNLSVALLSQGKLKEAIDVLEKALKSSPSTVVTAEPFLFNLSTLYELRSAAGLEKKNDLLIEVAKWSGDGLRTNCLKMPTN